MNQMTASQLCQRWYLDIIILDAQERSQFITNNGCFKESPENGCWMQSQFLSIQYENLKMPL